MDLRRMPSARLFLLAPVALILIVSGCAPRTGTIPGQLDPSLPYTRVLIADEELGRGLRFDEPKVAFDENGFITRVEVTVRATSSTPLRVNYRPLFKDRNGMVLQPEPSWQTAFLEMRVPERITLLPNGRNAVDYEVHFRWAQ